MPYDIQQTLVGNILGYLTEDDLFRLVKTKLNQLPQFVIDGDKDQLIDRLKALNSSENSSLLIHKLFDKFIDLSILEEQRIVQISEEPPIDLFSIKKLRNPIFRVNEGLGCDFEYEDGHVVSLFLNHSSNDEDLNATRINGALYLDDKLVPVRSDLERHIMSQ